MKTARLLSPPLLVLATLALVVSGYAEATRDYVEVRVRAEHVDARVYINCIRFEPTETGIERTFDLGWLKPQDVVSVEFTPIPRDDETMRKGYFTVDRRLNHGRWQTVRSLGTSGGSVDLPEFYGSTILASGTDLGGNERCESIPQWEFARGSLGKQKPAASRRDQLAFDVATAISPWLPRILPIILAALVGIAWTRKETLAPPLRLLVEGAIGVLLALATFSAPWSFAAGAAFAAIASAAWYEHSKGRWQRPPAPEQGQRDDAAEDGKRGQRAAGQRTATAADEQRHQQPVTVDTGSAQPGTVDEDRPLPATSGDGRPRSGSGDEADGHREPDHQNGDADA